MENPKFIDASKIETLEQYGAALISSMVSIQTLEMFHVTAWKAGLLNTDEEECSKTIIWELRRLMALYQKQMEFILDRCPLDQDQVVANLKAMIPVKQRAKKNVKI